MYKISIIIPVYNVEPYIERCLLSALNQTYQNIEIILIDDCGQDNSINVARKIVENHRNRDTVRFLKHEHNCGLSAARNTGISAATGDYVYFLDSDDEIMPNCIELLESESEGFEIVEGTVVEGTVVPPKSRRFAAKTEKTFTGDEVKSAFFRYLIRISAWNKLIHREFLLKNSLFFEPGLLYEDTLWTFMSSMKCRKYKTVKGVTYFYRKQREGSITTKFSIKNMNHFVKIYSIIEDFLTDNKMNSKEVLNYLIAFEFSIKNMAVRAFDFSLSDLKKLSLSKYRRFFFTCNLRLLCRILTVSLPVSIQYIMLKSYLCIMNLREKLGLRYKIK
ncbi:MAG: glycosyltransferase [Prevotellaceae bacterium]|jgi:glycosyltransferase involved in cell wall biosynthesis|nr:glycosyltransferase [Prevotellaceae bacterium]